MANDIWKILLIPGWIQEEGERTFSIYHLLFFIEAEDLKRANRRARKSNNPKLLQLRVAVCLSWPGVRG
jgi:hypothetical protein